MGPFYPCLLLIFASLCVTEASTPPRPAIPLQFTSSMEYILNPQTSVAASNSSAFGWMKFDAVNSRWTYLMDMLNLFVIPQDFELLEYLVYDKTSLHLIFNGKCYNIANAAFFNPFSFSQMMTYLGQRSITIQQKAVQSNCWGLSSKSFSEELCVLASNASRPVSMAFSGSSNITFLFLEDFEPSLSQFGSLELPYSCSLIGKPCPRSSVMTTEMVRFHSSDDYSLANHNTADRIGDTLFICQTVLASIHGFDQLISFWDVTVNSTWGAYGFCNDGTCLFGDPVLVGRESSEGLRPFGGQCSTNKFSGSWFSLTAQGQCPSGSPVGTKNCSWVAEKRQKTISLKCLLQLNFTQACVADGTFPFPRATNILSEAYTLCPDIPPPPSSFFQRQGQEMIRLSSRKDGISSDWILLDTEFGKVIDPAIHSLFFSPLTINSHPRR